MKSSSYPISKGWEAMLHSLKPSAKPFILVMARDRRCVMEKILELKRLNVPFIVICGEEVDHPNVVCRELMGKWNVINFGSQFTSEDADAVVLNDLDTKIHNFEYALSHLNGKAGIVYCKGERTQRFSGEVFTESPTERVENGRFKARGC